MKKHLKCQRPDLGMGLEMSSQIHYANTSLSAFTLCLGVATYVTEHRFSIPFLILLAMSFLATLVFIPFLATWFPADGCGITISYAKEQSPQGSWATVIILIIQSVLVVFSLIQETANTFVAPAEYFSYGVASINIYYAIYIILLAANRMNNNLLKGNQGRMGIPNLISIARFTISLILPILYLSYQTKSMFICALIVMVLLILSDSLDGFLARKLGCITELGAILDPIGDKMLFYPTLVAFMILFGQNLENYSFVLSPKQITHIYICLGVIIIRDALYLIWAIVFAKHTKITIKASNIDRIRMVFLCLFLFFAAIFFILPEKDEFFYFAIFAIICASMLSILTIFYDLFIKGYKDSVKNFKKSKE